MRPERGYDTAPHSEPGTQAMLREHSSGRRIAGLDIARALAIIGMVAMHVGPASGEDLWGVLYALPSGRASILFVVLAGLGMGLIDKLKPEARAMHAVRWAWFAAVLLPLGLALQLLDHGVWIVLHHYAALFLIGLLALRLPPRWLLPAAIFAGIAGGAALLVLRINAPDLPLREGVSISDPIGNVLLGLTVSGPYPLITWMCPFLAGMWLGRLDLRSKAVRTRMVLIGAGLALSAFVASRLLVLLFGPVEGPRHWSLLLTDAPHSQMPLWLLGSTGSAAMVIGLSLIAGDRMGRALWPLVALGQLALTVYVGHVLALHAFRGPTISSEVAQGALILFGITAVSVLFAVAWRQLFPRGPLELILHAPLLLIRRPAANP